MPKNWSLTQNLFEGLLDWLDSDREIAGQKYQAIHRRLIIIFRGRGCSNPEELADETINRVAHRVPEISEHYEGNPALYFYGVAQKVYLETHRKINNIEINLPADAQLTSDNHSDDYSVKSECLEKCLTALSEEDYEIVVEYYTATNLIEDRREIAKKFGLTPNGLRVRAFRLRQRLHKCVKNCLGV
jgi:DNA-directed RNA polymerase specialized sigma24 family protein